MKERWHRHKPLIVFWAGYTVVFVIAARLAAYIMPIVIAAVIAVMMKPVYDFFIRRFRFQPAFNATAITLLVYGALLGMAGFLLYLILRQSISLFERFGYLFRDFFSSPEVYNQLRDGLLKGNLLSTVTDIASSVFRIVPTVITFVIFTFVLTVFLLNHLRSIKALLLDRAGERCRPVVARVLATGYRVVRRFIRSYVILYLITFAEAAFIFWLTGVEYPLAFGFITAVADILPVLGPGTVYVPFAVMFFLQGKYIPAIALLVFFIVTSVLRQILEPKLVSDTVKVHPLAVMAAIYFSIVAMNIWILFYVVTLIVVYKVLAQAGVLPAIGKKKAN